MIGLIVVSLIFFVLPGSMSLWRNFTDSGKESVRRENEERKRREEAARVAKLQKEAYEAKAKKGKMEAYIELRKAIEAMPAYSNWRKAVIERCGGVCEMNGPDCLKNQNLEVHHRVSVYKIIMSSGIKNIIDAIQCHALWEVTNGVVLCKTCHDKMESSKNYQKINQT